VTNTDDERLGRELREHVEGVLRLARESGEKFAKVRIVGPRGVWEAWFGTDRKKKRSLPTNRKRARKAKRT